VQSLFVFFLDLTSSLLFEIGNVGGRDVFPKKLQSTKSSDIATVVVVYEEGYALDTLEFEVWKQQIVCIFFEILVGQLERRGGIDVLDVFESKVDTIDKDRDAIWVLFGVDPVVEFRQLDRVNLDEFVELEMKDDLFVGVGFATEAGIPDGQIGPRKTGVLVFGVAAILLQLIGKVDGFC